MNKRLKKVIDHPFHQYLGVSTIESEAGRGMLTFQVSEQTINPAGVLHGGVVYTLCDVCAYAGLLSILDPEQEAVTHDIHLSVMRSAGLGDQVVVRSDPVKVGKSLCFVDVAVTVKDRIVATARVTKSILVP